MADCIRISPPGAAHSEVLMNRPATRRHTLLPLSLMVTALVVVSSSAEAQVDPTWDHYKVYDAQPKPSFPLTFGLRDQFGSVQHDLLNLDRFANPVEKLVSGAGNPIYDPDLHYSWWLITPNPFSAVVTVSNQFGDHTLQVSDSRYLWNPAAKWEATGTPYPVPVANHYKCYDCAGPPVSVPVTLTDQFGVWQTTVAVPRWFCTPAAKDVGPTEYPIIQPDRHYVCYEYTPADTRFFSAAMSDQFINNFNLQMGPSNILCVPSEKVVATPTGRETWGRLKILYR
jgi:hypothetical protein